MVARIDVEFIETLDQDIQKISEEFIEIYNDWALDLADELQAGSPRGATLDLAAGWDVIPARAVAGDPLNIEVDVVNTEPTASYRVAGRGPGRQPPINTNFRRWLAVKGIPLSAAFAIARTIGEFGTERFRTGENFMGLTQDGDLESDSFVFERIDDLVDRLNSVEV